MAHHQFSGGQPVEPSTFGSPATDSSLWLLANGYSTLYGFRHPRPDLSFRPETCSALYVGAAVRGSQTIAGTAFERAEGAAELRDDEVIVSGYAVITGKFYDMWDSQGRYEERIARGAFKHTLAANPAVPHLINHAGMPLSSTINGSLRLAEDNTGLWFESRLSRAETDAADLISKLERGVMNEMSFAFYAADWEWNESRDQVTLNNLDIDRGDIASCNFGSNPYTFHSVVSGDRSQRADEPEIEPTPEPEPVVETIYVVADAEPQSPATEVSQAARVELLDELEDEIEFAAAL